MSGSAYDIEIMRAEQFAANVAASLVAHMGLFFAASRFMINTTGKFHVF